MIEKYTFKRRFGEESGWISANYDFNQKLIEFKTYYDRVLNTSDDFECLIVKRRFYKCATAPDIIVVYDYEELERLLNKEGFFSAGDILEIYIVSNQNKMFDYKIPDENNFIPEKGAY